MRLSVACKNVFVLGLLVLLGGCQTHAIWVAGHSADYKEIFEGQGTSTGASSDYVLISSPSGIKCKGVGFNTFGGLQGSWTNTVTCNGGHKAKFPINLASGASWTDADAIWHGTANFPNGSSMVLVQSSKTQAGIMAQLDRFRGRQKEKRMPVVVARPVPAPPQTIATPSPAPAQVPPMVLQNTNIGKRFALVIGNSDYSRAGLSNLANPRNDARDIAVVLKQQGFSLVGGGVQLNLTRQQMMDRILQFGNQLGPNTVGLFYYAGHGVAVDKSNYLVPVDGGAKSKREVRFKMVSADDVMEQFRETGGLNIMILDACRNTPAVYRGFRSGGGEGLAEMRAASGTIISYATQPGNVAMDGKGLNSPYATALMDVMKTPGLGILQAFNQVSLRVKKATNNFQVPWNTSVALEGEFFFAGR